MLPWAHPSHNPKRFSRFCTAHGRVSLGMSFPLKIVLLHGVSWTPLIHGSLGPPESSTQMASWSINSLWQIGHMLYNQVLFFPQNCPFSWGICTPSNTWFLGQSEPTTQTPSWPVQPFLHSSPQCVPIHYNGPHLSPSKLPLPVEIWTPSNIWFLGPTRVLNQTAAWSVQPFLQAHYCDRRADRKTTLISL